MLIVWLLTLLASACALATGTIALVYIGELVFSFEAWHARRTLERDVFGIEPRPAVTGFVGLIFWPVPRILRACGWRAKSERAAAEALAALGAEAAASATKVGRRKGRTVE